MSIRNRGGRWQYRFQVHGRRYEVDTGLEATKPNWHKVQRIEAEHYQSIVEAGFGIRSLKARPFNEAADEFINHERAVRKGHESTVMRIDTSMVSARVFFGTSPVSMIHAGNVEQYKAWRLGGDPEAKISPVKPVTVKHDLDNLSLFFRWAKKMNYCRELPTDEVDRPSDVDAVRINPLTDAQERLYFSKAKGNLADVGRLIILQGLRPAEVISLRKTDVSLEAGTLSVRDGKTRAARRRLKLTPESRAILDKRMDSAGPWVFPSTKIPGRHITKLNCPHDRVLRKTGLNFVLYDLRHTFGTRMVEAGVDLATLKSIMGHTDIRVTQRYVHPSQAHQDQAMDIYISERARRAKEDTLQ